MENKRVGIIIASVAVILFVVVAFIFLYGQEKSESNIIKDSPKDYNPEISEYAKTQGQFAMDLPCGVTDFDSPYVKSVQCDPEKMKKGTPVILKFGGRIVDEQNNGIEKIKMTVNNGELFYTDKLGFFETEINVDSNKKVINFVADKYGYSPIRKIYNASESTESGMIAALPKEYFANDITMRNIEVQTVSLNNQGATTITSEKYPGVSATIPVNGLVNESGQVVTGEITGEITYLNPNDPEDAKITPGFNENMVGVDRKGRQITLQSDGMVFFHFKEKGSDEILQPKKGVVVTITQPLLDDRYNYYSALAEDPSLINNDGDLKVKFTLYEGEEEFKEIVESDEIFFNYWYFNKKTGLWEEWPVEGYVIDLKNKLCIMKVSRLY